MKMATTLATKQTVTFNCSSEFRIGAYLIQQDEPIKAVPDGQGLFHIYTEWGEGALGRLNAHDVNKLAGCEVVRE
jgi:hypothetical protein